MSPKRGRKPTPGSGGRRGGSAGRAVDPAATRRLMLLVFGVGFLVLFLIVAIAEGIGDPGVPSGDVAVVEDAPADTGNVSEAEFERAFRQTAAQSGQKKPPKPGDEQYDELKEAALTSLLDVIWLKGQADEMGLSVTEKEVADEFKKLKDENFKNEAEYRKFLKDSKFTQADVNARVELQMLSTQIQEGITQDAQAPSDDAVETYYKAAKSTQFTQPETRDVRLVLNKNEAKANQAKALLEKDDSPKSWKKIARKFSEDQTTKKQGGLRKELAEGGIEEPVNEAIFGTPEGRVEGPVKADQGYYVFLVENSKPENVQELSEVEDQIKSQLEQQAQQETFSEFVADYTARWSGRTFCADDFVIERCANFKGDPHPATAPPACYEADPKEPAEACPAPVFQLVPAAPGTVTPLQPRGTPLAQRPVPAPNGEGAETAPVPLPTGP
ncbi:MAG TPA: peptidyl-prolyl cis-trans isomerase [Solirubrobacterales bacterium]